MGWKEQFTCRTLELGTRFIVALREHYTNIIKGAQPMHQRKKADKRPPISIEDRISVRLDFVAASDMFIQPMTSRNYKLNCFLPMHWYFN